MFQFTFFIQSYMHRRESKSDSLSSHKFQILIIFALPLASFGREDGKSTEQVNQKGNFNFECG
jgi:hypothetical protein